MALFKNKDDKKEKGLLDSAKKFARQGDSTRALKELQKAIELNPDYKEAYWAIGFLYSDLNKTDDAIKIFKQVIQIDKNSPEAWNNLGLILARCERYNEAIKTFEEAILIDPQNASFHNNLGNVYFSQGKYVEAMQSFQTAIKLDPTYAESYHRLGINKNSIDNNIEVSLKNLEEAAKTGKNKAKNSYDMGTLYAKQDILDKAIRSFQEAIKMDPRFTSAYIALGFAYEKNGDLQNALDTFGLVVSLNPLSAKVHNTMGLLYDKLNLYKQAINEYRKAIELEPNYTNTHFVLGQVYENKGNVEKAVAEYEKFMRIHETGPMVAEAAMRIAQMKNISLQEVDDILDIKKQDFLETDTPPASFSTPEDPSTASEPETPHPLEAAGVKFTNPREYLKQVLAKAKAAKLSKSEATNSAPEPEKQTTPAAQTLKPPVSPKTPPSDMNMVSASTNLNLPISEPKIKATPPTPSPFSEEPPTPTPSSLAQIETHPSIPENKIKTPSPSITHPPSQETSNSTFDFEHPILASALDGFVLDDHELLNTIDKLDSDNLESQATILEAFETLGHSSANHSAQTNISPFPPTPKPITPPDPEGTPPKSNPPHKSA